MAKIFNRREFNNLETVSEDIAGLLWRDVFRDAGIPFKNGLHEQSILKRDVEKLNEVIEGKLR